MSGVALLVASALGVGLMALAVLIWALGSGQYDDMEGAAERILLDDTEPPAQKRTMPQTLEE